MNSLKTEKNIFFILVFLLLSLVIPASSYANMHLPHSKNKKEKSHKVVSKKEENKKAEEPPEIGNFALRFSQQPGALVSIGQNVIEKNQTQLYLYGDAYVGFNKHYTDLMPGVVYQPWESCSIFTNIPYAAEYQEDEDRSAGIEDIFCQVEYAYLNKATKDYFDQATILAYAAIPTGSNKKDPATGFGSMSYFLGTTYIRTYVDWILFTSYGVLFPTGTKDTKYGNSYLYQCGIGKNICSIKSKLIVDWLIEIDGNYTESNKINFEVDSNSGGNIIYVTPSLWVSTNNLILQLGVGFPVVQQLNGLQNKNYYVLVGNLGWTF